MSSSRQSLLRRWIGNIAPTVRRPIALDATYSIGRNLSGVGVYSREILHGLAAHGSPQRFRWYYRPHRFFASFGVSHPRNAARRILFEGGPGGISLYHALNQRVPSGLSPSGASRPPVVVTFHDLFVLTGEYSTPEFRERFAAQARAAAERADAIVAVSAYTASQVESLLRVDASRIRVIWHGCRLPADPPPLGAHREPIVLHVGAIQKRKNIARLVEAFERMPAPWKLVLAGSQGYGAAAIVERIERSPARDRIEVRGYLSDAAIGKLYGQASLFAFPSLEEGFGIPLLEAMAHGLPVVTSNGSALREVAGDAALLVDPTNVDELAAALLRLSEDAPLSERLVRRGRSLAMENSWDKAVKRTWQLYRELLG